MPLCFPEKRTSGPEDIVGMTALPGLMGVAGMKGVETLGGIRPVTYRQIITTTHHIKKRGHVNIIKDYGKKKGREERKKKKRNQQQV